MAKAALKKILLPFVQWLAYVISRSPFLQKVLDKTPLPKKISLIDRLERKFLPDSIVKKVDGIYWDLSLKELLQLEIAYGVYDKCELKRFLNLLRKIPSEGVYIDVGANVGFYTLHLAKHFNGQGQFFAFEADPNLCERLQKNCQLNEFANAVKGLNIAVANHMGKSIFYTSDQMENSGWGSLTPHSHIRGRQVEIDTLSLDHFLDTYQIKQVDLIKIDVESNEFEVLAGAERALAAHRFRYIIIEFCGATLARKGKNFHDLVNEFSRHGYQLIGWDLSLAKQLLENPLLAKEICSNFVFSIL